MKARIILVSLLNVVHANNDDRFNYRETVGTDFGPEDWNQVSCSDIRECPGWPDGWELGVGWELERTNCEWCPEEGGNDCGQHRQSPIDLKRERSTTGHDPECYDYHWMAYQDGSCKWHDLVKNGYSEHSNNFKIERHSLQILQPIDENAELQCNSGTGRLFPRLDYSKGYPDWWFLSHTELTVPSEHTQEGKRYDAEVHLAHFYSVKHERKVGKVTLLLEADSERERWDFLDKLICQWRETEEQTRDECGLDSVPPYPGCRNPTREAGKSDLPKVDPYPFIDCNSVVNSDRICKPTSCCEAKRSTGSYCEDNVYGLYGDEVVASVCWWCCPGKVLAPPDGEPTAAPEPTPVQEPTAGPVESPSTSPTVDSEPSEAPTVPTPTSMAPTKDQTHVATDDPASSILSSTPSGEVTLKPSVQPSYSSPITAAPLSPSVAPQASPAVCSDYEGHPEINLNRICKDGGCCNPVRSASDDCHFAYSFFGDSMESVCSDCCNPTKQLAPAPPPHQEYPPIDCSTIHNPFRICKPTSCCNEVRSDSDYCEDTYEEYGALMGSVCWYCCSTPKEVDPSLLPIDRLLLLPTSTSATTSLTPSQSISPTNVPSTNTTRLRRRLSSDSQDKKAFQTSVNLLELEEATDVLLPGGQWASELLMDPENFEVSVDLEEEYVAGVEDYRRRQAEARQKSDARRLSELTGDNYINVKYSPYEWMREVRTEYYYRYEGTQMVPPCYETVHYRVMKDAIRIHPDQLKELERLLAWRIAPKGSEFNECQRDTAGKERPGSNGDAVDMNRPLQSYNNIHRKVFCECDDWDSKFQEDSKWCELDRETRFYQQPYNYPSGGGF